MQLPGKLETFSSFCFAFLESSLNFQQFQKKEEPHFQSISEVIHSETHVYLHT